MVPDWVQNGLFLSKDVVEDMSNWRFEFQMACTESVNGASDVWWAEANSYFDKLTNLNITLIEREYSITKNV